MKYLKYIIFTLLLVMMAGCMTSPDQEMDQEAIETSSKEQQTINLTISNSDNEVIGEALLTEDKDNVTIKIEASNLTPGSHGFHIHETGQCDAPDFESAGAHFNPTNKEHGFLNPNGPHAGDLPNITVAEDGTVSETIVTKLVTLKKNDAHSLLKADGTALIIHSDSDDYITDPAGNAGDRIACGVINTPQPAK